MSRLIPFKVLLLFTVLILWSCARAEDPEVLYIESMRDQGLQVTSEASCGSSPSSWLNEPHYMAEAYFTLCGYWQKDSNFERTMPGSSKKHIVKYLTPKMTAHLEPTRMMIWAEAKMHYCTCKTVMEYIPLLQSALNGQTLFLPL